MRGRLRCSFAGEAGNESIRTGTGGKVLHQIAEELKPEAAYFCPQGGERAGFFVVDMSASSQVVEIAERFFFGLNAKVEMTPVMAVADIEKGLAAVPGIIERYG